MNTLTKPRAKKPVRMARRIAVKPAAAPAPRLVPPPARLSAEIADLLPPPSKKFDAAAVERVVASRSER
jgi:hypothetical protein